MRTLNNDSYFLFFLNITQVNGFKGFVGYGIRELDSNETKLYCSNPNSIPNSLPLTQKKVNFLKFTKFICLLSCQTYPKLSKKGTTLNTFFLGIETRKFITSKHILNCKKYVHCSEIKILDLRY